MKKNQTGKRAGAGDDSSLASVLGQGKKEGAKSASTDEQAITVSQLAMRIDHSIKAGIADRVLVVGEISSLSHRTHYYFSLKDEHAVIGAVVFASAARRMSYTPKHGDSVIAKGRVEFYAPSGRVSLIVTALIPVGSGHLEQQFKERCDTLRAMGWFDPSTKHAIPTFPRRVAVVTSKDSAAVADVIDTMGKRCPSIDLLIVDVRVQGASAKGQIAQAITMLNRRAQAMGIDAIVLTRGGGSMEDLWAFNEMEVAQAIHDSPLPIVAAIGHETDTTIAELVADLRCATPTQAAMQLAPDRQALGEQLGSLLNRLERAAQSELRHQRQRLVAIESSRSLSDPRQVIEIHRDRLAAVEHRMLAMTRRGITEQRARLDQLVIRLTRHQPTAVHARREERLDQLRDRLVRTMTRVIAGKRDELNSVNRELQAIGPAQVLARGFTVTAKPDGSLVRSAHEALAGVVLITTFADGKVRSKVIDNDREGLKSDPRLQSTLSAQPKRKSRASKAPNPNQMGLF